MKMDDTFVTLDPNQLPGSIIFSFGDKEIMRIDPGDPPRITVQEGVDVSETAMAVLACLAPMIGRYHPAWRGT